jgi:lipopolysaccharide/colanic/teichoic acid biosynthesis glycosyltransferase
MQLLSSLGGTRYRPVASATREAQLVVKRVIDVICAALLLVSLVPVLIAVAVLVKRSSPGPVLFRQRRLGKDGRPFWLYKFRTMGDDCSPSPHRAYMQALVNGEASPVRGIYKLVDDPRVTPLGRCLRSSSLDELPQLWNILRGDMGLVGPRPPLPYEVELYGARERTRLRVKPGLTGLWQVSGRSRLDFHAMIEMDLQYVERWSLWLDIQILARTPLAVLSTRDSA